jgi:hypothetical protein
VDLRYILKCEDSFVLSQHAGFGNMTEFKEIMIERKLNKEITIKDIPRP